MMKKILAFMLLLQIMGPANASTLNSVTITYLNVNRSLGQVFIRTSTDPINQNRISCHSDTNWNFTFLLTSDIDKAMYSTLLAAKMAGKPITLVGANVCPSTGYGAIEELDWATVAN